jgi:spore coat-associated protein N
MSRIVTLFKASPRRVLLAFGGLMIATAIAVGSGANFNSTSANPSNVFTAGSITHSNSKTGAAILTATKMIPGGTSTGSVDIKNTGGNAGTFTLTHSNVVDTPTSPSLSQKLTLVIQDLGDPACVTACPAATTVYSGTISAMPSESLGSFAVGATHRYQLTVTFPDGGTSGADNAYQSASTSIEYDWQQTS